MKKENAELSRQDFFAGMALAGLLADPQIETVEDAADLAVRAARELIYALKEEEKKNEHTEAGATQSLPPKETRDPHGHCPCPIGREAPPNSATGGNRLQPRD